MLSEKNDFDWYMPIEFKDFDWYMPIELRDFNWYMPIEICPVRISTRDARRTFKGNGQKRKLPVLFDQNRYTLKTIPAESVAGRIWLTNTHYLSFLAKSDRVLPVIGTLLSFHLFFAIFSSVLAIFCFFPVGYSTTRTDQHGPQECSEGLSALLFFFKQ